MRIPSPAFPALPTAEPELPEVWAAALVEAMGIWPVHCSIPSGPRVPPSPPRASLAGFLLSSPRGVKFPGNAFPESPSVVWTARRPLHPERDSGQCLSTPELAESRGGNASLPSPLPAVLPCPADGRGAWWHRAPRAPGLGDSVRPALGVTLNRVA